MPVLNLGAATGDSSHIFGRVSDAIRFRDGAVAVADQLAGEIWFFASDGAFLGSVGGRGEGPGEFASLTSLEPFGDTLVAVDQGLSRISFVDVGRRVVTRTMSLPFHIVAGVQALGDSALVVDVVSLGVPGVRNQIEIRQDAVAISPQGVVLDTLRRELGQREYRIQTSDGYADARPMFPKEARFEGGASVLYGGSARRMEIDGVTQTTSGLKRRIVRVPDYDLALSPAEVEAERKALLGPNPSAFNRQILSRIPAPTSRPAYDKLLVDSLGYLWAEVDKGLAHFDEPRSWNVFAPDGEWLGRLDVPPHFDVFEIGGNWILGDQQDSLGADHPEILRLTRRN